MPTPVNKQRLIPTGHSKPVGSYSPGIAVQQLASKVLVFVTGQVATDADGNVLFPNDPAQQTHVVFDRIANVLAEANGTLNDLAAITIYVTDIAHFEVVSGTRNTILKDIAPSSTLVQVTRLAENGCLVEISGIAVI